MTKEMKIKTTEITWKETAKSLYTVIVITDGVKEWAQNFDNAVEAVNCYNKFIDYGTCTHERLISIVEPNGRFHSKIFVNPRALAVH